MMCQFVRQVLAIALLASLATLSGGCDGHTRNPGPSGPDSSRAGVRLFELPGLDGNPHAVTTIAEGRTVLAFWATWCQPCQAELVELDSLYVDMRRRGLAVYAISVDDPSTVAAVGPWVAREGYRMPVLLDSDLAVLRRYQSVDQVPFVVVLDGEGRVVEQWQGYGNGEIDALRERLEQRLAGH
jgi:cytochrome c biogenesis protein CcmG, thiol:disulfide interchange protein DsbE